MRRLDELSLDKYNSYLAAARTSQANALRSMDKEDDKVGRTNPKHEPYLQMHHAQRADKFLKTAEKRNRGITKARFLRLGKYQHESALHELSDTTHTSYREKAREAQRKKAQDILQIMKQQRRRPEEKKRLLRNPKTKTGELYANVLKRQRGIDTSKELQKKAHAARSASRLARLFRTEETMSAPEKQKREDIVMSMKKNMADFKKRYGKRAKEVMYATATKMAMQEGVVKAANKAKKNTLMRMMGVLNTPADQAHGTDLKTSIGRLRNMIAGGKYKMQYKTNTSHPDMKKMRSQWQRRGIIDVVQPNFHKNMGEDVSFLNILEGIIKRRNKEKKNAHVEKVGKTADLNRAFETIRSLRMQMVTKPKGYRRDAPDDARQLAKERKTGASTPDNPHPVRSQAYYRHAGRHALLPIYMRNYSKRRGQRNEDVLRHITSLLNETLFTK